MNYKLLFILCLHHMAIAETEDRFLVPRHVIGFFRSETSAPSLSAKLAVDKFNRSVERKIEAFTYKHFDTTAIGSLTGENSPFQNAIIVTGDSLACELVAEIATNSYLVCYGPLTSTGNFEGRNLYLSQQNPEAFVPCLLKMVKMLLKLRDDSESQETKSVLTVSMLLDRNHPSALVEKALFNNLSSAKIKVDINWLGDPSFSSSIHEANGDSGVLVVIAALNDLEARHLLCNLHRRRFCGQNVVLILLHNGEFSTQWIHNMQGMDKYIENEGRCGLQELLVAAEGHFILEIPAWDTSDERKTKIAKRELDVMLAKSGEPLRFDYNDGPLAFDSVWAMLKAFNSSTGVGNSEEFREAVENELCKSFSGLSGAFSFNQNRMRSGNKAVIIISRFESGRYLEVGRHFNHNRSILLEKSWVGQGAVWNSTWRDTHVECNVPKDDNWPTVLLLAVFGIVLFTLFVGCGIFASVRKRRIVKSRRDKIQNLINKS